MSALITCIVTLGFIAVGTCAAFHLHRTPVARARVRRALDRGLTPEDSVEAHNASGQGQAAMSTPTLIVVVITCYQRDDPLKASVAFDTWRLDHVGDKDKYGLHYYTNAAVENFFEHASDSRFRNEGSEGDCFAWAFMGDCIDMDKFVESLRPFIEGNGFVDNTTIVFDSSTTSGRTWSFKYDDEGFKILPLSFDK